MNNKNITMELYNYRFWYNGGRCTEVLKCDKPVVIPNNDVKWCKVNIPSKKKSVAINIEKVETIEEWITEEEL